MPAAGSPRVPDSAGGGRRAELPSGLPGSGTLGAGRGGSAGAPRLPAVPRRVWGSGLRACGPARRTPGLGAAAGGGGGWEGGGAGSEAEPRRRRKWRRRDGLRVGRAGRTSVRTVSSGPECGVPVPKPQTSEPWSAAAPLDVGLRPSTGGGRCWGEGDGWPGAPPAHVLGHHTSPNPAGKSRASSLINEESFIRLSALVFLRLQSLAGSHKRNFVINGRFPPHSIPHVNTELHRKLQEC